MLKLIALFSVFLCLTACSAAFSVPDEPLQDRYWRAVEIDGQPVAVATGYAEPHLVITGEQRMHGSDGCNRFNGSYQLAAGLRFGRMASTMMACVPPVDARARAFANALAATAEYRIQGRQMELRDAAGHVRMRLEATFLK